MSRAVLIEYRKATLLNGGIVEIKIWSLPAVTDERPHGLKYSLTYGRGGERIVGYDSEAGKGDHRHYRGREEPYRFETMSKLMADFEADVRREVDDG